MLHSKRGEMQKYFSETEDPRHKGYIKHKLSDVLTIVMCVVMCSMTELCEIIVFNDKLLLDVISA